MKIIIAVKAKIPKGEYCNNCRFLDAQIAHCDLFRERLFAQNKFGGKICVKCKDCTKASELGITEILNSECKNMPPPNPPLPKGK
jgi:hypothetical protein